MWLAKLLSGFSFVKDNSPLSKIYRLLLHETLDPMVLNWENAYVILDDLYDGAFVS